MEEARSRGELRVNSFVRLQRLSDIAVLGVSDLGDAEKLMKNTRHLSETASELIKHGITPSEAGWGGWLGRYQAALRENPLEMEERHKRDQTRFPDRRRDRSQDRGR
jgi:hypothetical protein